MKKIVWSECSDEQRMELLRMGVRINDLSIGAILNLLFIGVGVLIYLFWSHILGLPVMVLAAFGAMLNFFGMIRASIEKAKWVLGQEKGVFGNPADSLASGFLGAKK